MKPIKSFLFIISVFSLLLIISYYFPKKGIKISENFTLTFFSIEKLFSNEKTKYADISDIINIEEIKIDTLVAELKTDSAKNSLSQDSFAVDSTKTSLKSIDIDENIKVNFIEFPSGKENILAKFFDKLIKAKHSNNILRILHYGDSQIEGDRISSYLRYKLQNQFGGSGVGFLPAFQIYNYSVSMKQTNSNNWKRFTILDKNKTANQHKKYGIMSMYSRFTDSNANESDSTVHESWIKFEKSNKTYNTNRKFVKCKMFFGNNTSPFIAELYQGDNLINVKTIMSKTGLDVISWDLKNEYNDVTFKFSGKDSPDFYGFSFEDNSGVLLDNFALRGSSGLDFTKIDFNSQKNIADKIDVGLIILQYGINIVKGEASDYKFYENWFYNQIVTLKKIYPKSEIIVIGLSDMSKKELDAYESYQNVEQILEAQKNAAFKANCAFWDLYKAMGGKNSMPSWVNSNPPLAAKDYTHFSYDGAKKVAEMFYNSFIYEYNKYLKQKNL